VNALTAAVRPAVRALTGPVGSLRGVRTEAPNAVLTFDDGPDPVGTEQVLGALAERKATATFFVLVDRAERYRTLLAEVAAEGHEIALHGIDHRRLTLMSTSDVRNRTSEGKARLEDLTGTPVRWFRPPYGSQTPGTWLAIRRCGLEPVVWGPTAWDWTDRPVAEMAELAMRTMARGSVLLAHDGFAVDPDVVSDLPEPSFDRGELARAVIDGLTERGLSGVSLGEALRHGEPDRWAWFRR
jgi:peptidoglycan/xylan/chitin deacetylase (PgdA/CDA1 family)